MKLTRRSFLSASALTLLACGLAPAASAAETNGLFSGLLESSAETALPPNPLTAKVVDPNPFMGRSESNIHHDCYNTDSTDAVLPIGIEPEVNVAMEKINPNASPAIFFDNFDNPVVPLLGGLAIRDLDAAEVVTLGCFSPAKHDGGGYVIQSSYSFVDGRNLIVCPTSHNHVLMLKATDETGTPLPIFEKVLDINIKAAAERVLAAHPYDFVLGSQHKLGDEVDYYFYDYTHVDVGEAMDRYFDATLELVKWGRFHSLAHLTYPFRYIPAEKRPADYSRWQDRIDAVFRALRDRDIALEINVSGLRNPLVNSAHPDLPLVRRFRELGGEKITVGADAHRPEDVGAHIRDGLLIAREAGFRYTAVYFDGRAEMCAIEL